MLPFRSPLLFALLVSGALAASPSARAALIKGTDSVERQFPEVFAITYDARPDSAAKILCTAVLVHPRVLLTAAHCLPEDPTTPVSVLEGTNARAPTAIFVSVRTERNPVYFATKNETLRTGFDFGVVVLAQNVPGADEKTGTKLARFGSVSRPADLDLAQRDGIVVVGYGGRNTIHPDGTTGIQRWTVVPLAESIENAFSTEGPKGALSRGDSGGPAFVIDRDGARRLIGIASGSPENEKTDFTGIPGTSLYAGVRPKLASWIEKAAGISLFGFPEETPRFGNR